MHVDKDEVHEVHEVRSKALAAQTFSPPHRSERSKDTSSVKRATHGDVRRDSPARHSPLFIGDVLCRLGPHRSAPHSKLQLHLFPFLCPRKT